MDRSNRSEELMRDPRRGLFKLGIPIMVGMLAHTLFNIVDTIFVGTGLVCVLPLRTL
ncbi:MAG: hypothetical protein KAW40_00035 [Candidatus Aenigmarchaeota archaeon]|nr:hypothetical protein [Candidatus Aenigmarchaeota archaeon]